MCVDRALGRPRVSISLRFAGHCFAPPVALTDARYRKGPPGSLVCVSVPRGGYFCYVMLAEPHPHNRSLTKAVKHRCIGHNAQTHVEELQFGRANAPNPAGKASCMQRELPSRAVLPLSALIARAHPHVDFQSRSPQRRGVTR